MCCIKLFKQKIILFFRFFIESLKDFFVGSGVSKQANLETWWGEKEEMRIERVEGMAIAETVRRNEVRRGY